MAASAYDYALELLTARAYSTRDIRRKLLRKGFEHSEVEESIARLEASGLLDDERYAEQFVRSRLLGKGASKRRLKQQLFQRGIQPELSDSAISEVVEAEGVDLAAIAEKAAQKKLATLAGLDRETQRRRMYAFLARQGYDPDTIRRVLEGLSGRSRQE